MRNANNTCRANHYYIESECLTILIAFANKLNAISIKNDSS